MDPTKKELYTTKRTTNLDFSESDIQSIYNQIRTSDSLNWFITCVQGPNKVTVFASGSNGLDELISSLNDDDIYYGFIKSTISGMIKFYNIYFVGANVNGMKKGKGSLYKAGIFSNFEAHGEIVVTNGLEDATREFTLSQIIQMSKAKKEDILI